MLTVMGSPDTIAGCDGPRKHVPRPTGPSLIREGATISDALTTSALEKKTGVSRTTIYFYVRQGLLSAPQKTATGRSLYSQGHVALLRKIGELKRENYTLPEIKRAIDKDLARTRESELDLAGLEEARIRSAILSVASEEFAAKGYKATHVMAIIQKLGINPHIFYRHFPSKLELLLECFKAATPLPIGSIRQNGAGRPGDPGENVLRGLTSDMPWLHLSTALSEAIRTEGPHDREIKSRLAEAWDAIIVNILRDFDGLRKSEPPRSSASDELLAYSLIGAHRTASLRASWDDKFNAADLLRTHLFVFLALTAAVSGEVDIYSRVARYDGFIRELTAEMAVLPPAL